jgi:O-acetyl-ADP-ribose deacetylase
MKKEIIDRIEIKQGDITALRVDAVVNAANSSLLGGGGVDGAIHRAAGPELLEACKTLGGCPTGEARITRGYRMPAGYIIHTVGPVYGGKPIDAELLSECYRSSLRLAVDNGLKTIAFPAVSCGVYGYPIQEACRIAVDSTCRFLSRHSTIEKVAFILFSAEYKAVYDAYVKSLT